jgi:arylsulfatase A-like enzyme
MALLKELNLDDHTLVIFTSDNGPHSEGGHSAEFFESRGGLRGIKRALYEGGIRIPMIARLPGKVPAGRVSEQVVAFWDMLPTMAELLGVKVPDGMDGVSVLPAIFGDRKVEHPPLYWEFHEGGFKQAARIGNWKAVRKGAAGVLELFDLATDVSEKNDVAAAHPEVIKQFEDYFKTARTESERWPIKAGK